MACVHLRQLYQLCQDQALRLSAADLIHVVCEQCGEQEVCPSALVRSADEAANESPANDATATTPAAK